MANFQTDLLKGIMSNPAPVPPGEESNAAFCMIATAERLMGTELFRRGLLATRSDSDQNVLYPQFGVYPEGLAEVERDNLSNRKTYSMLVLMELQNDQPTAGVLQLLAMREKSEDVCRSKVKIRVRDGDIHEDTKLDTASFIMSEARDSIFLLTTGFRVMYDITEVRKEEL